MQLILFLLWWQVTSFGLLEGFVPLFLQPETPGVCNAPRNFDSQLSWDDNFSSVIFLIQWSQDYWDQIEVNLMEGT